MKNLFLFVLICFEITIKLNAQNATVITAPDSIPEELTATKVFLAGSIDMGKTGDWQANAIKFLSDKNIVLLNPRRSDWDPEWKPVSTDPNFRAQVEWELKALDQADIILMYLVPGSKSPISLLEFGLYASSQKLRVIAPEGFWRKGNVDIVAEKYEIPLYGSLKELLLDLRKEL